VKVPAGKAVLHLGDDQPGANARVLKIKDETTGITTMQNTDNTNDSIFDLQGRKVSKATKGLYIVNGKKVVK
jgi:hypothetical protein